MTDVPIAPEERKPEKQTQVSVTIKGTVDIAEVLKAIEPLGELTGISINQYNEFPF